MERLYREFHPKGVQFLHCLSGEAARTGRDFQKHYRSEYPHLIDPNRRVEKQLNKNGWPFYVIVDAKGNVVYMKNTAVGKDPEIESVLERTAPGKPAGTGSRHGTVYLEKTLKNNKAAKRACDTAPCLAVDADGKVYLSFVSDRRGRNEVFVLRIGGEKSQNAQQALVSAGCSDAYDAVIAVDKANTPWIFYTGLTKAAGDAARYDIFACALGDDGAPTEAINLTESDDDAMHPAAALDAEGRLWVAYYRWHKMGFFSRDKEVYARFHDGEDWFREFQLSPDDLPDYEDHTDPTIVAGPGPGVTVAWSWDMHPLDDEKYSRYQKEFHADAPTIFGMRLEDYGTGELLFLGESGLDAAPTLHVMSGGDTWCAWNGLGNLRRGETKGLFTSVTRADARDLAAQYPVEVKVRDICTPRLFEKSGKLCIVWASEDMRGRWTLKASTFESGEWSKPKEIEKKGNPRFPAIAVDGSGTVHLAFTKDDGAGRSVAWRKL